MRGDDLAGIAVRIGARIEALAGGGEVLVTSTVRDLVAGSGLAFADRGQHELKGVPGTWQVLAVQVSAVRTPMTRAAFHYATAADGLEIAQKKVLGGRLPGGEFLTRKTSGDSCRRGVHGAPTVSFLDRR